jgi:hypothetical protein
MPGTRFDADPDFDPQDQAEVFDETNATDGGDTGEVRSYAEADQRRTFEETPDVVDLLERTGDRDDEEALALDADEFVEGAVDDGDLEEDNELDYRASDEEHEDDIDGLGPEDGFNEARIARGEIEGLDEVRDASEAEGGEDDFTDFQSKNLSDDDLKNMGYSEDRDGETRAKPDR